MFMLFSDRRSPLLCRSCGRLLNTKAATTTTALNAAWLQQQQLQQ